LNRPVPAKSEFYFTKSALTGPFDSDFVGTSTHWLEVSYRLSAIGYQLIAIHGILTSR